MNHDKHQRKLSKPKYPTGIIIDLKDPQGNVFYLFGLANRLAKELVLLPEEYAQFKQELCQASTYEAHIVLLRKWFGIVFVGVENLT